MIDTSDIDCEIAEIQAALKVAEQRAAEADTNIRGGPDGLSGIGASEGAHKRVKVLRKRLGDANLRSLDRLGGKDLPAVAPKASSPPPVRRFTPTRRTKTVIENPIDPSLRDELVSLFKKYMTEDCIGRIEDDIHAVQDALAKQGSDAPREFRLGLYVGIVQTIARLDAQMAAMSEFQMRRRRELEARIDALERRRPTDDLQPSNDIEGLTKYYTAAKLTPLIGAFNERLDKLEAMVAQPSKPDISLLAEADRGVWREGGSYARGSIVTHKGHLWICHKDTSAQPDTAPTDWRMWIRKPRDGRDGKGRPT